MEGRKRRGGVRKDPKASKSPPFPLIQKEVKGHLHKGNCHKPKGNKMDEAQQKGGIGKKDKGSWEEQDKGVEENDG